MPREDREQQDLRRWQAVTQFTDDMSNPVCRVHGRVHRVSGVVRADHDDHEFRLHAIDGTVLQAPQDMFGPIAGEAEIERLPVSVVLLPDVAADVLPAVGDRVAQHDEFDIGAFRQLEFLLVT